MPKPMGFLDFLTVDYTQTGDPQLALNAKKRKRDSGEVVEEPDEALTLQQRQKRARLMKKLAPRIKLAKAKAAKKVASQDKLKSRAVKQARMLLFKKLTKDTPKAELSFARRQEIEKKLAKKKAVIQKIAKKLFPKVRAAELEKKRGKKSD